MASENSDAPIFLSPLSPMITRSLAILVITVALTNGVQSQSLFYKNLQSELASGWNTWSYGSMLTHVLLPQGLALKVNFRHGFIGTPYDPDYFLDDIQVDKSGRVRPIAHTDDGAYTELLIKGWFGNDIRVQSTTVHGNVYLLITPEKSSSTPYTVELQVGMMWNQPGSVYKDGEVIIASVGGKEFQINSTSKLVDAYHNYTSPYISVSGVKPVGFYTGEKMNVRQIQAIVETARQKYENDASAFGDHADSFKAIQSVLGWNTIYDASQQRVITPVTRGWNEAWQGYVLFNWDTYFAALLYSMHNKYLAYSNAIAVTGGGTTPGHVGFWQMPGKESVQSQPPVGSMVCWMIYEKHKERWFLEEVYDDLLRWNRWWIGNRLNKGYLTWGAPWKNAEAKHILLESGLDNSPMYEDVAVVDVETNSLFNLADVGLNSLYVSDCKYLAQIAEVLGKVQDREELVARAAEYSKKVQTLWNDEAGIFQNKYLDSGAFSDRLSPTLFYPMTAGIATDRQARRMIQEHLNNPKEFYGDIMIPSIAFNDKSFDNNYWRGSVWGPMNFLTYIGLKKYNRKTASELAEKSHHVFLDAWKNHHYVFENTHSTKGSVSPADQVNADPFYHWGALMGFMKMID